MRRACAAPTASSATPAAWLGRGGALAPLGARATTRDALSALVDDILAYARAGDRVLVMSNGGFGGIHGTLLERLAAREAVA